MTYFVINEGGELARQHGFPRDLAHKGWLTRSDSVRLIHAWAREPDGAGPNIIGTVLLVTFAFERRPYRGQIILTGRSEGLPALAVDAIVSLHTAIRCALMGVASGHGPEFDQQAISTALMATEGHPDDRTG